MTRKKRKALGRGLDALFPEANRTIKEEYEVLDSLPISSIKPNPYQPRRQFDEEKLSEMADSIREKGLLQPILVRRADNGYQLVAGERRLRAAKMAKISRIPCLLVQVDDSQALELALIENLQRENLNPIEEARGYNELARKFKLTQDEIAKRVGRERSTVANSLRLLKLDPTIREDLEVGRLSPGHARALLSLDERPLRKKLWSAILQKGLSVRQSEMMARELKEKKKPARKEKMSRPPDVVSLEEKLMSALGTRIQVRPRNKTSGAIVIHYASLEDIDRIMEILGLVGEDSGS